MAMIYCDGERDLFDEEEFLHQKDGTLWTLFRPYIHRKKNHIPEHFADGGYPVVFKDQEAAPGTVALRDSYSPPFIAAYRSILTEDDDWQALKGTLTAEAQPQKAEISLHFAGLDWPAPVATPSSDPLTETTKTLYQAQLQLINNRQQGFIDHDKAVRASDYAFHQAVFQAYLDVAKGQIDRSVLRTQFLTTAASAIGTVYTAIIALSFGLGQPNRTLPAAGIAPAIFLGLSIALAAFYLSYITSKTNLLNRAIEAKTPQKAPILPVQRLFDERNHLIEWVEEAIVSRVQWLHAAVISLAIGVVFLPIPFVMLPGWLIWLGVAIGILAVAVPPVQHALQKRQTQRAPLAQNHP